MTKNKDDESLISHIEALRKALLKCLVSIAVVLPFTFLIAPKGLRATDFNVILKEHHHHHHNEHRNLKDVSKIIDSAKLKQKLKFIIKI